MIVGYPLRIVRKFGEASFEPLIFTHIVGAARYSRQFGIFARFGAILLSSEHRQAFLCEKLPQLASFKLSGAFSFKKNDADY